MSLDELTITELINTAVKARKFAYAPYSHYAVGAALLTESGKVFIGVNVENAAYPTGMCAERSAVFNAVSHGEIRFLAMVVATSNGGSPCGSCRQVLSEFGLSTIVFQVDERGEVLSQCSVGDLLPGAFKASDLKP
jgi:cytidine deaminase